MGIEGVKDIVEKETTYWSATYSLNLIRSATYSLNLIRKEWALRKPKGQKNRNHFIKEMKIIVT